MTLGSMTSHNSAPEPPRKSRRTRALGTVLSAAAFCAMTIAVIGGVDLLRAQQGSAAPPQHPPASAEKKAPLVIVDQGARPFGGVTVGDASKASIHCDHGYVEWQIPEKPRKYPLLMVHASSTKTWQTTFDGRDGFQNIFLRRGYPVYITDLPWTGRAGQACQPYSYTPRMNNDQASFTMWRLGLWLPGDPTPHFYPGVQFPTNDPEALNEFLRIQYPEFDTDKNEQIETDAAAVLLKEMGPSVVFTHSSTGIRGWWIGIKSGNTAAIVSFEPLNAVFPEGELPDPIARSDGKTSPAGETVTMAQFTNLTKIPILTIWGDNIPDKIDPINQGPRFTLENRRITLVRDELMAEAIKRHGGHMEILKLPEMGIHGNTHFPMLDLNNVQVADLVSDFLKKNGLDKR